MRQASLTVILMSGLLAFAATAQAQFWPRHHGGYYGGDDMGVWGAYASAIESSTSRQIAEQNRLAGAQAAMQQNAALQNNIRNTMTSQAQERTQDLLAQRQSNRDWWFQVQQQQTANRLALAARSAGVEAIPAVAPRYEAPTDVIKWLPVLCDPRFAEQRAAIEAPYRRVPKQQPTVADYEKMIDAAQQMKVTLGQMTAEISAQEYLNAEKFLDQLAAEARGRIDKDKAAESPAK
jgi:hypothetical protein